MNSTPKTQGTESWGSVDWHSAWRPLFWSCGILLALNLFLWVWDYTFAFTVGLNSASHAFTLHYRTLFWGELLSVGQPVRHQIEELPVISAWVIEHRCPRVRCPGCGERTRALLPADVAGSAFGPRFEAAVAVLSVRNRVSRRDVVARCQEPGRAWPACPGSAHAQPALWQRDMCAMKAGSYSELVL